jgi:hypothetical protein
MPKRLRPDGPDSMLAISPKTGDCLLVIRGNIVSFSNIGQLDRFVEQLTGELANLKAFVGREAKEVITADYAKEAIVMWEKELKEVCSQTKNEDSSIPTMEQQNIGEPSTRINMDSNRRSNIKELNQGMTNKANTKQQSGSDIEIEQSAASDAADTKTGRPQRKPRTSSRGKTNLDERDSRFSCPPDFRFSDLSWVLNRLAITDCEGGSKAKDDGYFVLNVAGEIESNADAKIIVDPDLGSRKTLQKVEQAADLIDKVLSGGNKKVVVHCAMGMERSVLSVVWYLHKYVGMTVDQAYGFVKIARPVAKDRRSWIGMTETLQGL